MLMAVLPFLPRRLAHVFALATLLACAPALAGADSKPLWELGLGAGILSFPDYRGSDQQHSYVLPVPYVVYRGDILRADRHGIRGRILGSDRLTLELSLNAALPVNSRNNDARGGMPDLKPTVEIGPALNVHLWRSVDHKLELDLRLPLRAAITIERRARNVGWLVAPVVNLDAHNLRRLPGWHVGMQAGPLFADRKYNQTIYGVAPAYATAARPAYAASGGYAGTQFTLTLSRRFGRYWLGAFTRYDTLRGAVFADSPLLRRRSALAAGVALAWVFGVSSRPAADGYNASSPSRVSGYSASP